jgi:hypothetical protein
MNCKNYRPITTLWLLLVFLFHPQGRKLTAGYSR